MGSQSLKTAPRKIGRFAEWENFQVRCIRPDLMLIGQMTDPVSGNTGQLSKSSLLLMSPPPPLSMHLCGRVLDVLECARAIFLLHHTNVLIFSFLGLFLKSALMERFLSFWQIHRWGCVEVDLSTFSVSLCFSLKCSLARTHARTHTLSFCGSSFYLTVFSHLFLQSQPMSPNTIGFLKTGNDSFPFFPNRTDQFSIPRKGW